jgi:hypothetical protein
MANSLYVHDDPLLSRHQDNIMTSLAQRLQRARSSNDFRLVQLLEQEKRQVEQELPLQLRSHWFTTLQNRLNTILFGKAELQVSQFVDSARDAWWYAFDPQTGHCVYADSEAELRLWIKDNYQGR